MATMAMRPSSGETLQERSKGKDVRISNIVAAKVRFDERKNEGTNECSIFMYGLQLWCGREAGVDELFGCLK